MSTTKSRALQPGNAAYLFRTMVERLVPEPTAEQTKTITAYTRAMWHQVDRRRRATTGVQAVGQETLSATATVLFGAALVQLGFSPNDVAKHGAPFGVSVRGLIASA